MREYTRFRVCDSRSGEFYTKIGTILWFVKSGHGPLKDRLHNYSKMYHNTEINYIYKPVFISKERYADKANFLSFIEDYRGKTILDLFASQKQELIRIRHPKKRLTATETEQKYHEWASSKDIDTEGVWVYYPWSERLLHLFDENELIELRTRRNQYKINTD